MIAFEPPLWTEYIHILSPNLLVSVNGIGRHTEDGALGEVYAVNCQATFRSDAREADRRGGVYPQSLVDGSVQVRKPFHLFKGTDKIV